MTKCVAEPEPGAGLLPRRPQRVQPRRCAATIVTPGWRVAQADGRRRPRRPGRPRRRWRTSASSRPRAAPATSGNAATICPACPSSPVSWVTSGARRAGNHSRDQPQHADERHRVAGADEHPGREPERQAAGGCHQQLPAGHEHARRRRSCGASRPGRALHRPAPASPRTRASWTTPSSDSTPALIPKRCCASRPATPSEARWKTATVYAKTPSPHITQARRATVRTTRRNTLRCHRHPRPAPQAPVRPIRSSGQSNCRSYT